MKSYSPRALKGRVRAAAAAVFALVLAAAGSARAYTLINIDFNDSGALSWIVNQARGTFAAASGWNGGPPIFCSGGSGAGCWQYAQSTTDGQNFYWFYVYDWSGSTGSGAYHYHLPFEDSSIGACTIDPGDGDGAGYGRLVSGTCVAPTWTSEPRYLMPEDRDAWVQTWADNWKEFKPWSVTNKTSTPIQIWVLATDGYWYYTDGVGQGITTGLSEIADDRTAWEVDIGVGSAYTGYGPFAIDNFWIQYP